MDVRSRLIDTLDNNPLTEVVGKSVENCLTVDGYKLRLMYKLMYNLD